MGGLQPVPEQHGIELAAEQCEGLFLNEYVVLQDGTRQEPARFRGDGLFEALIISAEMAIKIPKGIRMQALNHEQRMLMDAILTKISSSSPVAVRLVLGKHWWYCHGAVSGFGRGNSMSALLRVPWFCW